MKNMIGKPRPDLLARCEPDFQNASQYRIGGFAGEMGPSVLYSSAICQQTDKAKLDDGFRSYPSGHSSSASAALVYLTLFLASKLAVTIPFANWWSAASNHAAAVHAAFPSRGGNSSHNNDKHSEYSDGIEPEAAPMVSPLRRQAAAPPLYLLTLVLVPFGASIWVASSRWYDFRHHGFDILFGWFMGLVTAIYSFRYYHMPMQNGAGWAWGPRSRDRAFWAGVGRLGYAGENEERLVIKKEVGSVRDEGSDVNMTTHRENARRNTEQEV